MCAKQEIELEEDLQLVNTAQMGVDAFVEKHFEVLYERHVNDRSMPYGVAKARDGDPHVWLSNYYAA